MAAAATQTDGPFLKNSIIWQRKGPLPVWGWMLAALALLFVVMWWRRNRAASAATTAATGYTDELPGDQTAPPIFIVPQGMPGQPGPPGPAGPTGPPGTVPDAPPGGGANPPLQIPKSVSVPLGGDAYAWVSSLADKYPSLGLTFVKVFGNERGEGALNPGARKYLEWKAGPGGPTPYFKRDWSGRGLGIPALDIR